MKKLSHIDSRGNASMVDISGKLKTLRRAEAICEVLVGKKVLSSSPPMEWLKGMFFQRQG